MLELISAISVAICLGITYYSAYTTHQGAGQTVKESMVEAWENILVGFSFNFVANFFILPMVDSLGNTQIDPFENFLMGWIYTAVSMVRSFWIRRRNNKKMLQRQVA